MTFSPRLECSALYVYFLFCSSEIRRGADEPNQQHRRRGDVSALKVLAPEQGSCFPDERGHEGGTRRTASWATKDQGGTTRSVGLSRRPACEWDLMNWSGLCISLRMEQQSRHSRSTVSCKLIVHIHPGDEPIENHWGCLKRRNKIKLQVPGGDFIQLHLRQTNYICYSLLTAVLAEAPDFMLVTSGSFL